MKKRVTIVLKSGYTVNVMDAGDGTVADIVRNMSTAPGATITIGNSVVVCSEIAAILEGMA